MSVDGTTAQSEKRNFVGAVFAATFASLVLSGCSSPTEWYKDTVDFFAGEDEEQTADAPVEQTEAMDASAERTEKKDFPDLASVPPKPKPAEGLVGDTSGRRYADAPTRQGEPVNALAEAAPVAPAPPSMPTEPVTSAPLAQAAPTQAAPQQMAAAPAMAPAPDDRPTNVLEVYRQGLAQTRPFKEPQTAAGATGTMPTGDGPSMFAMPEPGMQDFGTVVISSDGVNGLPQMGQGMDAGMSSVSFDNSVGGETPQPVSTNGMTKVATILFDNGSAGLSARDRGILKQVRKLQQQYGAKVHVVGHASSRTRNMDVVKHKMVNYRVSVDRAEKVTDALVRLGVPRDVVTMDAVSDSDPIYYEIMPSGEAGNRRAEVYLAF